MIKNYLRSAFRNIARHKFISFINIFGLTIGLTCCLLILTYIVKELSYDKFNHNAPNIYRVSRSFNTADGIVNLHLGAVAPPFGPLLKNEFPDIKKVTRLFPNGDVVLRYKDKLLTEKGSYFADENFLSFFDLKTVAGDPKTALSEPYTVMMTEDMARKYFGNEDPINKEIRLDNTANFKVTGIFKPFPPNSQMHPQMLMSFNTLNDDKVYGRNQLATNWGNNSFFTYLLLPDHYNIDRISSQFPAFIDKYMNSPGQPRQSKFTQLHIQRFLDIHLHSHLDDEVEQNGDIKRVYIFSAIALFILLIACINYMNLSTARSTLRAKEIGIRKVIGAQQKEIITQFLSESVLITYFSLVLASILTWLLLPFINRLSELGLSINSLFQPIILISVLLLPLIIGLISGIYPAIFMSSFKPIKVLKGILKVGSGNISFRKVLVVVQFSISIILIVATTIVFQQLRYIQTKSLGFNKDHLVTLGGIPANQFEAFRAEVLRDPAVKDIGRSSRIPSGRLLDDQGVSVFDGDKPLPVKADIKCINADYGFIPTYGIKMAAGRNFSREFATDSNNFVINASAVSALGWKSPENAIGKDMSYGGVKGKVIGVVNDFHFESLHQNIIPLLMEMPSFANNSYRRITVKIDGNRINSALATLRQTWKKYQPETPFEYSFLDERFQKLYNSEQEQGNLFTIFSCLAIFIACLGLFGLSAFIISQRVKEIGVRKVLGASIPQIVTELSKDFLKLVIVAAVIALPIAWYAMSKWLLDFAFRVNIQWWVFVMAGVIALIIAFATISYQSVKAAMANPVKSLRSE
ncbi:FtsX-like permease family protein [Mucilaginibacter rubeus]|uniref:ABC transporter permease n=1 Tax=Mucilaginibacter rubeus TaxID=2027860 RepID=A0AAE6MIF5_9SPHI|nr:MULTISPECIES: ABC transporter permease [Mucilaginibacter]QEM04132.1 FtsX-like permease family protein [Mucilaginibacter rubeus]QEM16735.1 FtsX-like permease family protein [Mucilaginibacter gossypii]QTE46788.1 ABC transporter permease [Mucilaginibacter rubeus]QTE53385.1 ABC transporter permease [Mucilaginibacter rubeus]QTE58471.1 ABC transporter permease [Mucilaginibacter rubeus]